MKQLFFFLIILLALQSKATNDTLTRAQVYNFNVGDTMDYKNEDISNYTPSWDRFSYYRIVITGKFYSRNQDTLFYARKIMGLPTNFYNYDSVGYDTLKIEDLQMAVISYDYLIRYFPNDTISPFYDSIANVDTFNGRTVNKDFIGGFGGYVRADYATGLGVLFADDYGTDGSGDSQEDITTLIYYSQAGQTWGTPYNIAAGVININQQNPSINLFPTINNGQFKISVANGTNPTYQLAIYDLTGREIKTASLSNGTNNIELENSSSGMYLWSVLSDGAILKSGKLVIQ